MRHLKLFESVDRLYKDKYGRMKMYPDKERDSYWDEYLKDLNREINKPKENTDDYYKLIDNSDYDDYEIKLKTLFETALELEEDEIENIKKMFPKIYSVKMSNLSRLTNSRYLEATRETTILRIWKLEDEWFLVALGDIRAMIYFKCDQWEGLEYFLNKTLIKK